jgi:Tfp pilus assembly protein PilO
MPRNFKQWQARFPARRRDPRGVVRAVLGALLALNLAGLWFVFNPPGGSLEDLERETAAARREILTRQGAIARLKLTTQRSGKAREAGDAFLAQHFLGRQTAYSTLVTELGAAAKSAGIKPREQTFAYEPIEGSDTLSLVLINATYEGSYADLIHFVNEIDRSERLLTIDQLQAQPLQGGGSLTITVRMNAFVREEAQP